MYNNQPNQISRLDQLLSRNQAIYKNLRTRCLQISKSNQKIDANISNIKPLYSEEQQHPHNSHQSQQQQHTYSKSSPIQSEYHVISVQQSKYDDELVSPKFHEIKKNTLHQEYKRKPKKQHFSEDYRRNYSKQKANENHQEEQGNNGKLQYQRQKTIHEVNLPRKLLYFQQMNQDSFRNTRKIDNTENHQKIDNSKNIHDTYNSYHSYNSLNENENHTNQQQDIDRPFLQTPQISQSYIFIPFNKLFRSPTMTIKKSNQLVIARRSRTKLSNNENIRMVDCIKYRNNNIFTDQEPFLKRISQPNDRQSLEIGLVGGTQTLKKKLHMDILSYVYTILTNVIMHKKTDVKIQFTIQHQETITDVEPEIIRSSCTFLANSTDNRISLVTISSTLNDIFSLMKKKFTTQRKPVKRIRVSKLNLIDQSGEFSKKWVIMSTNKIQHNFITNLGLSLIVWCLNPLYKFHEQSIETLEQMKKLDKKNSQAKKYLRKTSTLEYSCAQCKNQSSQVSPMKWKK